MMSYVDFTVFPSVFRRERMERQYPSLHRLVSERIRIADTSKRRFLHLA